VLRTVDARTARIQGVVDELLHAARQITDRLTRDDAPHRCGGHRLNDARVSRSSCDRRPRIRSRKRTLDGHVAVPLSRGNENGLCVPACQTQTQTQTGVLCSKRHWRENGVFVLRPSSRHMVQLWRREGAPPRLIDAVVVVASSTVLVNSRDSTGNYRTRVQYSLSRASGCSVRYCTFPPRAPCLPPAWGRHEIDILVLYCYGI
jgi:hypothetical protein